MCLSHGSRAVRCCCWPPGWAVCASGQTSCVKFTVRRGTLSAGACLRRTIRTYQQYLLGIIFIYPAPLAAMDFGNRIWGHKPILISTLNAMPVRALLSCTMKRKLPLQHRLRSTVTGGAALVFALLLLFVPLDMPIKFTLSISTNRRGHSALSSWMTLACGGGRHARLAASDVTSTPQGPEYLSELAVHAVRTARKSSGTMRRVAAARIGCRQ